MKLTLHRYNKVSTERNPSRKHPDPPSSHSEQLHAHIYLLGIVILKVKHTEKLKEIVINVNTQN